MKLAVISALIASAAAFAPASVQKQGVALLASPYEKELGVQAPVSGRLLAGSGTWFVRLAFLSR